MRKSLADTIAYEEYHARRLSAEIVEQMFEAAATHGLNPAALFCAVETALGQLAAWNAQKDRDRLYRLTEFLCDQLRKTVEREFFNPLWIRQ